MAHALEKYRRKWAEPEAQLALQWDKQYQHVLVVPAFREAVAFLEDLASVTEPARALSIVVVNATEAAQPSDLIANDLLLRAAREHAVDTRDLAPGAWRGTLCGADVLFVDRSSPGRRFALGQGVGKARKLGCDIALELIALGQVRSPWIPTTDADVRLPQNYFQELSGVSPQNAAVTFSFEHRSSGDAAVDVATANYEASLRYHLLGLHYAGSPYAFHTVGSCLAVRADAYAAVHGFPERQAAEDFYLLNKVAKIAPVARVRDARVSIQSRISDRTPFGTGSAVSRQIQAGAETMVSRPACFGLLRAWLSVLDGFALTGDVEPVREYLEHPTHAALRPFWEPLKVQHVLIQARAQRGLGDPLRTRLHVWFDGFRTLKFLHAARAVVGADIPVSAALEDAEFVSVEQRGLDCLTAQEYALPLLVGPTLAGREPPVGLVDQRHVLDGVDDAFHNPRLRGGA